MIDIRYLVLLFLVGCSSVDTLKDKVQRISEMEQSIPPPHIEYVVEPVTVGSLYAGRNSISLYQDSKAYRVGDILTVELDERTESQKSSTSAFAKSNSVDVGVPTFGTQVFDNISAGLSSDRSFGGNAKTNQGNRLSGSITVTVRKVYPNGVLLVSGEKWLSLTQGDEYIKLSGHVRVEDVGPDNRVSSERLADARISYAGEGATGNAHEPGWLAEFLNSKWMPF